MELNLAVVSELQARRAEIEDEIRSTTNKNNELERQLSHMRIKSNEAKKVHQHLKSMEAEHQGRIESLRNQVRKLQDELHVAGQRRSELAQKQREATILYTCNRFVLNLNA